MNQPTVESSAPGLVAQQWSCASPQPPPTYAELESLSPMVLLPEPFEGPFGFVVSEPVQFQFGTPSVCSAPAA